jgi:8-oxo-dGTP pyrophosphatase MutT (NUDIX family)
VSAEDAPRPIVARPLFDPESVPLDPAFSDPAVRGEAVAAERLRPRALQRRFAVPPAWQPEIRADARLFDPEAAPRDAAVLMPLVARGDEVAVLLTQRTAHLYDHAGQISFPGGRVEPADVDAVATALRESEEEIGLSSALVHVLGVLPQYLTATGYRVTPVVGIIEQPVVARLVLERSQAPSACA